MNLFEKAVREKTRFDTIKGIITVEQLWDMKLTSKDGYDLDTLAQTIYKDLKESSEISFITPKSNEKQKDLEFRLELVKHIIDTKMAEAKAKNEAAVKAETKKKIMERIAKKQDEAMDSMSIEDLQKQLDSL